jgi:glycerol-3-phosphate dehydrogenase
VFFVIPWRGHTVVGTTETPVTGSPDGLQAEPEEIKYLLGELRRLFPRIQLGPDDVLGTFAGIRPLARSTGWLRRSSPGAVSRKHRIIHDGPGVLSVVGGKYTTYRAIARQVVDEVFPGSPCTTHRTPLPGGEAGPWSSARAELGAEIKRHGEDEIQRLFQRYGMRLRQVLKISAEDPSLAARLDPQTAEWRAEVVHALRHEFAAYPEDFLARRTHLRYSPGNGRPVYSAVEELVSQYGQLSEPQLEAARERYNEQCTVEDGLRCGPSMAD